MTAEPFVFLGCIDLKEMLPYEARDVRELLEVVGRVPIESLFCHTAAALLHRSALPTGYPNDFAHWTGLAMGDQRLAERLAAIDPSNRARWSRCGRSWWRPSATISSTFPRQPRPPGRSPSASSRRISSPFPPATRPAP
jgi:hypothetical protein